MGSVGVGGCDMVVATGGSEHGEGSAAVMLINTCHVRQLRVGQNDLNVNNYIGLTVHKPTDFP